MKNMCSVQAYGCLYNNLHMFFPISITLHNSIFCIQSKYLNLPSFILYIIFSLSIRWKMVACIHLLWRLRIGPLQVWISEAFQDVNAIWPFPGGRLNHGHAKHFTLDCPSKGCFGFSLECSLSICSQQGKRKKTVNWKVILQWKLRAHLASVQSSCVSVLCRGVMELLTTAPSRWPEIKPSTSKERPKSTIVPKGDGFGISSLF